MLERPPGGATMRWPVRLGLLSSIWAPERYRANHLCHHLHLPLPHVPSLTSGEAPQPLSSVPPRALGHPLTLSSCLSGFSFLRQMSTHHLRAYCVQAQTWCFNNAVEFMIHNTTKGEFEGRLTFLGDTARGLSPGPNAPKVFCVWCAWVCVCVCERERAAHSHNDPPHLQWADLRGGGSGFYWTCKADQPF